MENDAEIRKLKVKYPDFFAQFPEDFLNFVFSDELALKIVDICFKNGIDGEEEIEKISSKITLLLFDQIPRENFVEELMKETEIDLPTAQKIALETKRLILAEALELRKKEISTPSQKEIPPKEVSISEEKKKKFDIYREPIE